MIKVNGGVLYQWDIDRTLAITKVEFDEVHFENAVMSEAIKTTPISAEAVAIPNELLQMSIDIVVYVMKDSKVAERELLNVEARAKPADYVTINTADIERIIDESGVLEYDIA